MPRLNKTVFTKRQTNLSWAICSMLMCFPIGLVAVLVALKSKRAWRDDRPETAGDMADMAKTIALTAILFSTMAICIFTALLASGHFYWFLNSVDLISHSTMQKLITLKGEEPVDPASKKESDATTESEYYYYYDNVPVTEAPQVKEQ